MFDIKTIGEFYDILHKIQDYFKPEHANISLRTINNVDVLGLSFMIDTNDNNPIRHVWSWTEFNECLKGKSSIFDVAYMINNYVQSFENVEYTQQDKCFINLLSGCNSLEELQVKMDLYV